MTESADDFVQQTLVLLKGMQDIRLTCTNLSVNKDGVQIDNIRDYDPVSLQLQAIKSDEWMGRGEPA